MPVCKTTYAKDGRRSPVAGPAVLGGALAVLMACGPVQDKMQHTTAIVPAAATVPDTVTDAAPAKPASSRRAGGGMPPNPERPFTAKTCEEARARLTEAKASSPLISASENAEVVQQAHAQVARLCATP